MTIRSSAAREILPLIDALRRGPAIERESALARLSVIGERGVPHLLDLLNDPGAPADAHVAALSVLETVADTRALEAALPRLADHRPAVACAAAAVVRRSLAGAGGDRALDALAAVALDGARDATVRLAALAAIGDLPAATRAPLWETLAADEDPRIRAFLSAPGVPDHVTEAPPALPRGETPTEVRRWIDRHGPASPLPTLHQLVERIREREGAAGSAAERDAWATTRAEAHQVLAARGSRVALYDLRETLEAMHAHPAPAFLQATERIGDASVLEPLARLYGNASSEPWWRERVSAAARAILARERLTARNAIMKKVKARYPSAYEAFTRR